MSVDPSLIPATVGPRFTRHDGSSPGADDDFIVLPDPLIGQVISAGTNRSLRGYQKGSRAQLGNRIALLVVLGIFGALFGYIATQAAVSFLLELLGLTIDQGLLGLLALGAMILLGLVGGAFGFFVPLAFRKPTVTYVGRLGLQRHARSKFGGPRNEIFRFSDADELRVTRTRNHYNGVYVGTTYEYRWSRAGKTQYQIKGTYRDDKEDSLDPVNFAFAAEKSWTAFRLQQVDQQIKREGVVRFRAGSDWIGVGRGFIEIGWRGTTERLDRPAIQSLTLDRGTLVIKRQGAKEGLFRSEGVFRFPVSEMADFRTFLVALEACTGCHVT